MAKSSNPSPDEALAGAASSGRAVMGREGTKFSSPSVKPGAGKLVPKGSEKSVDPAASGTGNKVNIARERTGATYRVTPAYMKQTDPSAGATQANGRIIKSATNRDRTNFDGGAGTSY